MRMHIEIADEVVAAVDELAGPRGRSAFIRRAIGRAVDEERRWTLLESAAGAVPDRGHDWDAHPGDPAEWVRAQRRGDARRGG